MSMWTDREVKKLIARVQVLEYRVEALINSHGFTVEGEPLKVNPPPDRRTKEYKEWKSANSSPS